MMKTFYDFGEIVANCTLNDIAFQKLLHSDATFDVIVLEITMADALLGLGHYFDAPVVGISPFGATKSTSDLVGAPEIASYIPNIFSGYTDKMTFGQRFKNWMWNTIEDIGDAVIHRRKQQNLLQFYPKKNMPTISELKRGVSFVLLNTHVVFGFPRPYPPNMVEVGGLHINRSMPHLPFDVQQFLDDADEGAIFFSMGTHITFSHMPDDKRNEIFNSFKKFPQIRLLIKSDVNFTIPSHDPSLVMIRNWFPQQGILAHPNLKLFITHGGLLSTMELIYFGKPLVGIPVVGDQHLNMKLAVSKGYGESVPYQSLNGESFQNAVEKVLNYSR